jgi:hypothetical protein
MVNSNGKYNSY